MFDPQVLAFLGSLAREPDRLMRLRSLPKPDVLAAAAAAGYGFDEAAFDATVWQTEIAMAGRLGEPFDFGCSMWETMWGKYYLEYLVANVAGVASPDWPELAGQVVKPAA